jgi:hypothetical protein
MTVLLIEKIIACYIECHKNKLNHNDVIKRFWKKMLNIILTSKRSMILLQNNSVYLVLWIKLN